ncbi:hypothetical protein V8E55_008982 [Tylopilus felleus]
MCWGNQLRVLQHEYGLIVVSALATPRAQPEAAADAARQAEEKNGTALPVELLKSARRDRRTEKVHAARHISADWPSIVPQDVVLSCLNQYYEGLKWTEPLVCAVCGDCGQYQRDVLEESESGIGAFACRYDYLFRLVSSVFIGFFCVSLSSDIPCLVSSTATP